MLLTLTATSLQSMLVGKGSSQPELKLVELPAYARQSLGLHGVNLSTSLLSGMDRAGLAEIRERCDKEGCACLMLSELEPQSLGAEDSDTAERALERTLRVIEAASILGCNAASIRPEGADDDDVLERTADALKRVMSRAERLELNLLVEPHAGLTETPDRVTALLKKIGGFRVGTLPNFAAAAASEDPTGYLRRLTPYASVVQATLTSFKAPGGGEPEDLSDAPVEHAGYAIEPLVAAVMSVGYDGTLAIHFEGSGDPSLGVLRSRQVLEEAMAKAAETK